MGIRLLPVATHGLSKAIISAGSYLKLCIIYVRVQLHKSVPSLQAAISKKCPQFAFANRQTLTCDGLLLGGRKPPAEAGAVITIVNPLSRPHSTFCAALAQKP